MKLSKHQFGIFLSLIVIASLISSGITYAVLSFSTVIEEGSMVETASYVVWVDGSTCYAKNGLTGEIEYSGTNATQIINVATDQLSSGGNIFLTGHISIDSSILIDRSYVGLFGSIEWGTEITYTGSGTAIRVGIKGGAAKEMNKIENIHLIGHNSGEYGIEVFSFRTTLRDLFIENFTTGTGILFSGNNTTYSWAAFGTLENVEVSNCLYGLHIGHTATLPYNEVDVLHSEFVGGISGVNITGIHVEYGSAKMYGGYVAGWDNAIKIDTNNNDFFGISFEANNYDLNITTGQYTRIVSSSLDLTKYVDTGYFTQILSPTIFKLTPITHPNTTGWDNGQAYLGRMWYCTDHSCIEYWNGTAIVYLP